MTEKALPAQKQLAFLEWEMGVFLHFGIRTFYEGHTDWDMKEMDLNAFLPVKLDCNQWLETIQKAGAKYAVLVCKHHDGFANWPSEYTEYSVANTPWKDGKGDVVREFVEACRRYRIKVGLYYSPAEFSLKDQSNKDYDAYFINQISELLSSYGKIDYLWFDGCGSETHRYDTVRIVNRIRELQSDILIFNMWDPDTRWVGNESGYAPMPNSCQVDSLAFSVLTEREERLNEKRFLPIECDIRMRRHSWFYSGSDEDTVKSLDELMGIYYYTVGRGANLLINIGPDRRGLLPDKDASCLIKFGNEVKKRFSSPIDCKQSKNDGIYICELAEAQIVDHVVMKEDITIGSAVEAYRIEAYPYPYGSPITIYNGQTIGHKAICCFPAFYTNKIRVMIEKSDGREKLDEISLFCINKI